MVLDAQRDSLQRVKEEKDFAKAVKSDEAEVPVYLWNRRIHGVSKEERDKALTGFRKIGLGMFLCGLRHDCYAYMVDEHGVDWCKSGMQKKLGKLTQLGRDQLAITGILWHATHTNWFEYKAGTRLYHLRFPVRYQKIARDGVPILREKKGPTSRARQPPIRNEKERSSIRDKVEKAVNRRYIMHTGVEIKSLICYFAVPKGDDDVRMV